MDENLPVTPGTAPREDSFDITVRGYNRQQVLEYMSRSSQLLATLEQHLAVARADVHRARSEAEQAQAEIARLRSEQVEVKPVHEEVSGRLSQILRLAAEEADQERATADAEIAKLHAESQAEAERIVSEARASAERDLAEARATADRELTEARSTAERDLRASREEADRLRLASVRHAEELLDDAQRRAGAVNEVSNQRLETLTATHGEAVLRLGQIRDVLADLLERDAAAGSLAQVVESVIAPAGAPAPSTPAQAGPEQADSEEIAEEDDDEQDVDIAAVRPAEPVADQPKVEVVPIEASALVEASSSIEAPVEKPVVVDDDDDTEIDLRDPSDGRVGLGQPTRS